MKRRILTALFVSLLLICTLVIVSCGNNSGTDTSTQETNEQTYKVKVVDYKGTPVSSGLFVQLYKDGVEFGSMKKANKDGEASFTLEKGEYTFELIMTDNTLSYDKNNVTLTQNNPEIEVMLYRELGEEKMVVAPYDPMLGERVEKDAYFITEGATLIPIEGKDMNYYIFQPTRGGIYRFSYIAEAAITIGYYGRADFILEYSIADVENRAFEVEIKNDSVSEGIGGTTTMAIGVKSMAIDSCIFTIERISDPKAETPRTEYLATQVPSETVKYDYLNATLVNINVMDSTTTVVYNSEDGYYHYGSESGPIVLVRIKSQGLYLAPFYTICETTNLYKIIKDANGNPLRVEIYNQMILDYAEKCDEAGVVALTPELEYAIKNMGEQQGWWGENSIFKVGGETLEDGTVVEGETLEIDPDIAWLFACCYLVPTELGTEEQKITISDTVEEKNYNLLLDENKTIYLKGSKQVAATLTVFDAEGITLSFNGVEYTANENGQIVILFTSEDVVEISITSTENRSLTFTYVTYLA